MTQEDSTLLCRLADLRRAFDETFAAPPPPVAGRSIPFLALTSGALRLAVPLTSVATLEPLGALTPWPARAPALLGLAVVRRRPVAVYSLAVLLDPCAAPAPERWLIVPREAAGIGLAIAALPARIDVHEASLAADGDPGAPSGRRVGDGQWEICDLDALARGLAATGKRQAETRDSPLKAGTTRGRA